MTKFRFPGRTSRNAANRTRVRGYKGGPDEAAITAEKIYLSFTAWQHLFGSSNEEDLEGFGETEVQEAVSSAVEHANNSNLESEFFLERLQESQEIQEQKAATSLTTRQQRQQNPVKFSLVSNDVALRKFVLPSKSNHSCRTIIPNKKFSEDETENETENSTHKNHTVKIESDYKIKKERSYEFISHKLSKSEKRLCKSNNILDSKRPKTDTSPKNSSIILKPSTLKFESFNSGYTLGLNWINPSTPTVKPTSLPDAKGCIICERITSHPDCQCDWCRSFMEQMTCKNTQKLICLRGRGICKIVQTDMKSRCHACWLACCLTKLPVAHKTLARLKKCLPTSLQYQIGTGIPVKKDPLRGWSDNIANQTQIAARALMKKATKTANNKNKVAVVVETNKKKHKGKDKPKRQKAHLKGPRIKHVCRRACVVLGQPQAMFPESPNFKSGVDSNSRRHREGDNKFRGDKKILKPIQEEQAVVSVPSVLPPDLLGLPVPPPNKTDAPPGWICLDFDPLEGSAVPVMSSAVTTSLPPALCLLCGSSGKEELLFCAMCCEPYHVYCLNVTPQLNKMWICERCELCCECNNPTLHHDEVMRCHKCAAPYHKHCLTIKSSQRPWECPTCNVCRSCGTAANNMRQVGNTAFCAPCYKLRLKGNFCPLCQQCYQDNDYDTKMVECAECLSWVHARCEGITDEKYQILSYLPESVEFHCQNCSTQSPPLWWLAVENEVKNGMVNIVKNLAKYRSIKFSPQKVVRTEESSEKIDIPEIPVEPAKPKPSVEPIIAKIEKKSPVIMKSVETSYEPTPVPSEITDKQNIPESNSELKNIVNSQPSGSETVENKPNEQSEIQTVTEIKVPDNENNKPNENKKSENNVQITENSIKINQSEESENLTKKDPKVEAAKVKLDFSDEKLRLPRLVVRLTDYVKQKPKATQTLKLKQICDAYNIKECSVHLRKCNSQLNIDKIDKDKSPEKNLTIASINATEQQSTSEIKHSSTEEINRSVKPEIDTQTELTLLRSPNYKTPDKNANYDMKPDSEMTSVTPSTESQTKEQATQFTVPKEELSEQVAESLTSHQINKPVEIKQEFGMIELETKSLSLPYYVEPKVMDSPKIKNLEHQQIDVKQLSVTLRKASHGFYESLFAFDLEFQNDVLKSTSSELKEQYLKLLNETFPWYKPGEKCEDKFSDEVVTKMEPHSVVRDRFDGSIKKECEKTWSQMYLPGFCDERVCAMCKGVADSAVVLAGERMLHTGLAPPLDWVHANCALWSSEVWEDRDGFLHSVVPGAVGRANRTKCALCGNKGASVGCCHASSCPNSYHWPCAVSLLEEGENGRVVLDQIDMSLFCPTHAAEHAPIDSELEQESQQTFTLARKLLVEPGRNKKRYADPQKVQIAVGSLRVERLGVINSSLCHDEIRDVIVPDGYVARRLFWSTIEPWRIVEYEILTELEPECSIEECLARDINLTVEHGTHGAPQEVMEKNLRVLRHIQQQEMEQMARDSEIGSKENAEDLLLPPDLKETIFQDLNNELLDGISMQDIFTKLLSEDAIKEEVLSDTEEPLIFVNPVREVIDCLIDQVCLLDSPIDTRSRKRTIRSPISECLDDMNFQNKIKFPRTSSYCNLDFYNQKSMKIPQLDGADDSSSDSESASKSDDMKVEVETSLTRKIKERSLASSEPCTEGPVKCSSCKRTYRTRTSYDKHLSSCTEVSSDSSDESTESPTTSSRMSTKASKYGTVVLKTKLVLMQSPEKNPKRKSSKTVRKTVKLAAKPSVTPAPTATETVQPLQHIATIEAPSQFNQNIMYQEPMIMGQNPIFLTQPSNAIYYINLTPNKQQNYFLVNNPESPGVVYVQAAEQESMAQSPIILQQAPAYGNMMTLNPSFNAGVNAAFCQPQVNAFLPTGSSNITYNPSQQAFAQVFSTPLNDTSQVINSNSGGIFLSQNPQQSFTSPQQTYAMNQAANQYIQAAVNSNLTRSIIPPGVTLNTQESPVQIISNEKLQEQTFVVHNQRVATSHITSRISPVQPSQVPQQPTVSTSQNISHNIEVSQHPRSTMSTPHHPTVTSQISPHASVSAPQLTYSTVTTSQLSSYPTAETPQITYSTIPAPSYPNVATPQLPSYPSIPTPQLPAYPNAGTPQIASSYQPTITQRTPENISSQQTNAFNQNLIGITKLNQPLQRQNNLNGASNPSKLTEQQHTAIMTSVPVSSHNVNISNHNIPTAMPRYTIQTSEMGISCNQQNPMHLHGIQMPSHVPVNPSSHHNVSQSNTMVPVGQFYPQSSGHIQHQHTMINTMPQNNPPQVSNYYQVPQVSNISHQQQFRPRYNAMQPRQPSNYVRLNNQGMVNMANYSKKPTSTINLSGNISRMPHHINRPRAPITNQVATATRLYVQPPIKTYSNIQNSKIMIKTDILSPPPCKIAPAGESKVVKITASASVGTQTTQRCATPNQIKKEPADNEDKTGFQFKIKSSDGYTLVAHNVSQAWQNIFDAVQKARKAYNLSPLPYNPFSLTGQHLTGLGQDPIKFLIEQLPGVAQCSNYTPKFHNTTQKDPTKIRIKEPKLNPSGCARSEPFKTRHPYDMFGWLASAHRKPPPISLVSDTETTSRRASNSLPMAMRFRQLKNNVKVKVGVFRSHIHGRGLFCLRDLEPAEMVIEYAGEVIRSSLTDKREKIYESRGIGCYMFRVDDQTVVDATMKGNAARFINHSCEPNCYSRVVDVLGKKHILIFALRRILPGEELTYDYKFPFEEDKIPCTCASRKCRKYLN